MLSSKTKESASPAQRDLSSKGWNWGYYHMREDKLEFTEDAEGRRHGFSLDYKDIAISNASKDTEVTLEFQHDNEGSKK